MRVAGGLQLDPASCTGAELAEHVRTTTTDLQAASKATYIYALRTYFHFLQTSGARLDNPATAIPIPKQQTKDAPRVMSENQWARFVGAIESPRDRALVYLLGGTGLRVSEALSLRASSVKDKFLTVVGKGNKVRRVAMPDTVSAAVREWMRQAGSHNGDDPALFGGLSQPSVYVIVRDAAKKARVSGVHVHPHGLRHWYATMAVRAGVDLISLANTLGHANLETTRRYVQQTDEKRLEIAGKLGEVI